MTHRPNYFIVGAPKCGTSALFDYLGEHPRIFNSAKKEPFFFGTDLPNPRRPTMEEYLRLFRGVRDETAIGEASTAYLHSQRAAAEIRAFDPAARIIISLRNPVDLIASFFHYSRWQGVESEATLEAALAAQERRRASGRQGRDYRAHVGFTDQVRRYFDVFGRHAVHVILFEELVGDTARVYRSVLEFLEVDPTFQPEFRVVNATRSIRSPVVHRFISRPPAFASALAAALLPGTARRRIFARLRRLNSSAASAPAIDAAVRERLADELRPEVERLSELLDRDLGRWTARMARAPHTPARSGPQP